MAQWEEAIRDLDLQVRAASAGGSEGQLSIDDTLVAADARRVREAAKKAVQAAGLHVDAALKEAQARE